MNVNILFPSSSRVSLESQIVCQFALLTFQKYAIGAEF